MKEVLESTPAALIIGYLRLEGIKNNIELCLQNQISSIYVSIDYPKNPGKNSLDLHNEILEYLNSELVKGTYNLRYRVAEKNVGCAANVITACDWVFENEEFGFILEDDCLPSNSFFNYAINSFPQLESDDSIWMICGTQLVPEKILDGGNTLSAYPQVWGWATSKSKWLEIRRIYFQDSFIPWPKLISKAERSFWQAGENRAKLGIIDAWDIILASQMRRRQKLAIVPAFNLISNIGYDSFSTHTKELSEWLFKPSQDNIPQDSFAVYSAEATVWLKNNFYKIRLRHLLSTKLTGVLDYFRSIRNVSLPLISKLDLRFSYYFKED